MGAWERRRVCAGVGADPMFGAAGVSENGGGEHVIINRCASEQWREGGPTLAPTVPPSPPSGPIFIVIAGVILNDRVTTV